MADDDGAALAVAAYDAYGDLDNVPGGRFGFTGQMWIAETGVYHDKARAYDPDTGTFLQPDPIGYAGGANLYAYVGGDPVNFRDPWGLRKKGERCITVSHGQVPTEGDEDERWETQHSCFVPTFVVGAVGGIGVAPGGGVTGGPGVSDGVSGGPLGQNTCEALGARADAVRGYHKSGDLAGTRIAHQDDILAQVDVFNVLYQNGLGQLFSSLAYINMYSAFSTGGELDAKSYDTDPVRGNLYGNFLYGAVGNRLGFSEGTLLIAAAAFNSPNEVKIMGRKIPGTGWRLSKPKLGEDIVSLRYSEWGQSYSSMGCDKKS